MVVQFFRKIYLCYSGYLVVQMFEQASGWVVLQSHLSVVPV